MPWISPIFDRSADDITNKTKKAFFNVLDWIRVNGNTDHLNTIIEAMLGVSIDFTELDEPNILSIPTADEINTFIQNIENIRLYLGYPTSTGIVALKTNWLSGTSAPTPDYNVVNSWEKDLSLLRELLIKSIEVYIYCGVSSCGQQRFWQARFRQWQNYILPEDTWTRYARCGVTSAGTSLTFQSRFRRYA